MTKAFSKTIAGIKVGNDYGNMALQSTAAAVVGGGVSEATGGKFGNGARTAGFGYLFNQVVSDSSSKTPIDRRIGDAESGVEITDENALLIFKAVNLRSSTVSQLAEMQPFDQNIIDLATEALAAAVIGDVELNNLLKTIADSVTIPSLASQVRTQSIRYTLHEAALDGSFDTTRLNNALQSRFDGVGRIPRIAAGLRIQRHIEMITDRDL